MAYAALFSCVNSCVILVFHCLTTPTGKPVGFLLPSLACNRAPYEYFHRLWNTGISLFEQGLYYQAAQRPHYYVRKLVVFR